jgi:hypothetical protein
MWHLRLSGGVEISERQVRTWDNVPKEVEIEKAALVLPRSGGTFYMIELPGYERYCIARSVSSIIAGAVMEQGYCLYGQYRDWVTELEVLPSGMRMKSYAMEKCQLPERCWRKGIS